jgi:hypothetical protein
MKCQGVKTWWRALLGSAMLLATLVAGCEHFHSPHTVSRNYSFGDAPVDPPESHESGECHEEGKYDDFVKGGVIFKNSCGCCHYARPLGERPFSNVEIYTAHMRQSAYLTGKEYRQLIYFMRRWHDVGPATPDVPPSPKRFFFSQPISELRDKGAGKVEKDAAPADKAGKEDKDANGSP